MTDAVVDLEEKELLLLKAAVYGLQLLQNNNEIEQKNRDLEGDLAQERDNISQLKHDIRFKYQPFWQKHMLHDESGPPTPKPELQMVSETSPEVEVLCDRICKLEKENVALKLGQDDLREKMEAVSEDLQDTKQQMSQISKDLSKAMDSVAKQQEEINSLRSHMSILQQRNNSITSELEGIQVNLTNTGDSHRQIDDMLSGLDKAYNDVLASLDETRRKYHNSTLISELGMECDEDYFKSFDDSFDKQEQNGGCVFRDEALVTQSCSTQTPQTGENRPKKTAATDASDTVFQAKPLGKPGKPGTFDLDTALRILSNT